MRSIGGAPSRVASLLASLVKPLVVMRNLFAQSITDLSWGTYDPNNGSSVPGTGGGSSAAHSTLIACSTDGTVAALRIDESDLGQTASLHIHK